MSNTVPAACPGCKARLLVPRSAVANAVHCPHCRTPVRPLGAADAGAGKAYQDWLTTEPNAVPFAGAGRAARKITFNCVFCPERYDVEDSLAGRWVKCRGCNKYGQVPQEQLSVYDQAEGAARRFAAVNSAAALLGVVLSVVGFFVAAIASNPAVMASGR